MCDKSQEKETYKEIIKQIAAAFERNTTAFDRMRESNERLGFLNPVVRTDLVE